MWVTVRFFALLRELYGQEVARVELPEGATVGQLFDHLFPPGVSPQLRAPMMFAVNQAWAPHTQALAEGDEVAFIPPVSGGVDLPPLPYCHIGPEVIHLQALVERVEGAGFGAIVTFQGTVRDHAEGRQVDRLEYESYLPMARTQLAEVAREIQARWGLSAVAMAHRVGVLELGEVAVAIAVAAAHRAEAFEACRYAIDRIKETVPIWKKEHYVDDAPQWK